MGEDEEGPSLESAFYLTEKTPDAQRKASASKDLLLVKILGN